MDNEPLTNSLKKLLDTIVSADSDEDEKNLAKKQLQPIISSPIAMNLLLGELLKHLRANLETSSDAPEIRQPIKSGLNPFRLSEVFELPRRATADIFLCHSSVDKDFVRRIAKDVRELGISAWFDEWELTPGDSLHDSIGRALESSSYVAVVLSPDSVESKWCKKELNQALSRETREGKKVVIPIRCRNVAVPAFLEDKVYLDCGADYYGALARLGAYIHKIEQRELDNALQTCELSSVQNVVDVLKAAGLHNETLMTQCDWKQLKGMLGKYEINIPGNSISIINPFNGRTQRLA